MTDEERPASLENSFKSLSRLVEKYNVSESETGSFEEAVQALDLLLKKNQARLDELERNKPL